MLKVFVLLLLLSFNFNSGRGQSDVCLLEQDVGPCKAAMPRYSFNSTLGCCVKFIYGGCQGNGNNFETRQQCEETCAY